MQPIVPRMRAYFAPVGRAAATPSVFDPAKNAAFSLDAPPAPWIDVGWIENFERSSATKLLPLHAGVAGAAQSQFRSGVNAQVKFDFTAWGKLQMALSSGSQHMNILAELPNASDQASGGPPVLPGAVLPGSTPSEIVVGVGVVNSFAVGDIIAVDSDYAQQIGYVGSGVAGAYVKNALDVLFDINYIRRITFNVGRIAATTLTTLQLAQPLIGGVPPANAQVQKVIGFVDREGGSFFQEWSALFVALSTTGARVFYHYPRLQSAAPAQEKATNIADSYDAWSLRASFIALPTQDINDGEQVLCYRSYLPASSAALY
jgi:hypothetical protein